MTMDGRPGRREPGMVFTGRIITEAGESAAAVVGAPMRAATAGARTPSLGPRARWRSVGLNGTFAVIGRACAIAIVVGAVMSTRAQAQEKFPDGPISKIEFEGNATITPDKIKPKLLSRIGQPLDQDRVEADLKTLMGTKWFSDVRYYLEESPPKSGKYALIFVVREMPLLTKVEFPGRKSIRLKEIEDTTGLKVGNRADPTRTRLAVGQILRLYQEKGYDLASVTLKEGGNRR